MNKKNELLVITMEECGELIQACSKIIRKGDNKKEVTALKEEAGDVLCMLKLLESQGYFTWQELEDRVQYKCEKLKKCSRIL